MAAARTNLWWIAGLLALACLSCDLTKPSDRQYNSAAHPIDIAAVDPALIRQGQHFAGTITFEISAAQLSSLSSPVTRVELQVDGEYAGAAYASPYILQLETWRWPDGVHEIAIGAFERDPNTGLAGMEGVPSLIRVVDVVFDQSPPTPVTLSSVVWDAGVPLLTWTMNGDSNFYAYGISRVGNYGPQWGPPNYVPAGPLIFGRDTLTYRDASITGMPIGIQLDYAVHAFNRVVSAASNSVRLQFGESVPGLTPSPHVTESVGRPVFSSIADEFYVQFRDSLRAHSSVTQAELRRIRLTAKGFALSQDGATIYAVAYDPVLQQNTLQVYSAATFGLADELPMGMLFGTADCAVAAGRPNRVYAVSFPGLFAIDAGTGGVAGLLRIDLPQVRIAISPDANTLYAATPDSVYRIDISTDRMSVTERSQPAQSIADLQLSPDGQKLYLGHVYGAPSNYVEILDPATLASTGQLAAPAGEQHYSFFVTSTRLYMASSRQDPNATYTGAGRIVQHDRSSLAPLAHWDLVRVPIWVGATPNDARIYAEGAETWTIPTDAPVPLVWRNR